MNADAVLMEKIAQLRVRVRLLVVQRWVLRALLAAVALCLLVGLGMRLAGAPLRVEWLVPILAAAALAGAVIGWTRPVSAMDAARLADQRLGLRERLSSGLEFVGWRGELTHDERPTTNDDFVGAQTGCRWKGAGWRRSPWRSPR
jgi:hypothetical protein